MKLMKFITNQASRQQSDVLLLALFTVQKQTSFRHCAVVYNHFCTFYSIPQITDNCSCFCVLEFNSA